MNAIGRESCRYYYVWITVLLTKYIRGMVYLK